MLNHDLVDLKLYSRSFHCENPQLPHEMCTLAQDRKAWSVWRSTVGTTRNPHERLSQAESEGGGGEGGRVWGKSPYLLIFSFFKQPQFWSVLWRVLPFTWYIGIWHVTSRVKHLLCKYNFQRILWLLTESKQSKWLFPGLLYITILFHPTVPDHLEILFQWHKWNCTFLAGKTTDFVNSEVNYST